MNILNLKDHEVMIWIGSIVNTPYHREDVYEYKGQKYVYVMKEGTESYWEKYDKG